MTTDSVLWRAHFTAETYDADQTAWAVRHGVAVPSGADFTRLGLTPAHVVETGQNISTTAGLGRIASLVIGSGQAATSTAVRIGMGDGVGTAAITDVDLSAASGSTHRWFQIMDATFPSVSGAIITFKATFASADGNFAWNECCLDVGTPTVTSANTINALMLNHKTSAGLGTKTVGTSVVATCTVTFS